ncbi:hypothetical protein [Pseudoduganella violaceinigra]|uniref:hypothetical protein n=1 Tax=Pseudoduganella violaceinigra TaxID=246602 RepID=UPI00041517B9|nr:hypothetical protein [Pseudoduganella violaceinigra]
MKILFLILGALLVASLAAHRLRQWRGGRRNERGQCAMCGAGIRWNNAETLPLFSGGATMKVCQRCHARHYTLKWTAVLLIALGFAGVVFMLAWTPK